jgi:hypothetical protein
MASATKKSQGIASKPIKLTIRVDDRRHAQNTILAVVDDRIDR